MIKSTNSFTAGVYKTKQCILLHKQQRELPKNITHIPPTPTIHLLKRKALTLHVSIIEGLFVFCGRWSKLYHRSNSHLKMNRYCALRILNTKRITGAVSACEAATPNCI